MKLTLKHQGRLYRGYKVPGRDQDPPEDMIEWMSQFNNWEGDSEGIVCYFDDEVLEYRETACQGTDYVIGVGKDLRAVSADAFDRDGWEVVA